MSGDRSMTLEEQVKSLSDELMQCQADKEFVWSLWKRLQVANPDLTQAVSLVVEREKHKAEMRDRKVLEILQFKDHMIEELEQKVVAQQQEMERLAPKKTTVDDQSALMKELTALREQTLNNSQELKELKQESRMKEEEERQVVLALEKEKEGLTSCCATLRADLEEKQRQANRQQEQIDAAQTKVKQLEEELHNSWQQLSGLQSHCSDLEDQLSSKEKEAAATEAQLIQLQRDYAEVQTLYRQSAAHAAEQSQLIKQLEGLNLDTQKVLRNQEEAHTADASSYQRLYTELSQCYQALVSSEANLRQSHQETCALLAQRDKDTLQLQSQLQQQQIQLQQQAEPTTIQPSSAKQTNFKTAATEQVETSWPDPPRSCSQGPDLRQEDQILHRRANSSVRRQEAPVLRSRSLSPASSVELCSGKRREAEQRIQDLEELLQLKMEENEELRRAHDNRRERICVIQTHYKTVREQLRELEKSNFLPGGKMQRAEPWQLRQENCDAVWNELTYFKNLTRKLTVEKTSLEEELDMLRVQAAVDRATVKELHLCLANEHMELLHKVGKREVKSSAPKKASISSVRLEQSFKKIEQLERRMMSLEEEAELLRDEKEQLLEAREDLTKTCCTLKASLEHLRTREAVREEAALSEAEQHRRETAALEVQLAAAQKEATPLQRQLLKLRQDLGILRAARDFYKNRATGQARAGGIASNISSKVKFKSHRRVSRNQAISCQGRSPSPAKDEWEDISLDSDSGEGFVDSLNSVHSGTTHGQKTKSYRCSLVSSKEAPARESNRNQPSGFAQDHEQHESWEHGTKGAKRRWRRKRMLMKAPHRSASSSSLQQRIESQQRHIDVLRRAKEDAVLSAKELHRANERIRAQLTSLSEKLSSSKQLTQKLTSDLTGKEQQKKVLEMELKQWRQSTFPQQPAPTVSVTPECSSQGRAAPAPANAASQTLEAEVKQLQAKVKSTSAEVTKQVAANKALRGQLQEKEDQLRQLQDKTSHAERDANMKRQLVEDLKTRLKFLQEMEKSYRGQVEDLEKKVKTLSEEATNRKALIESLKRRLSVATTEKSQHEASCTKLKEDVEKKEQRVQALLARLAAGEKALADLEKTATDRMEGLAQQSSHALDKLQRQLSQATSQLEQLHSFIQGLASEILLDVQEVKQHLMRRRRRQRQAGAVAAKGGLSAKSMIRAKSIAASILNMSENDLADIMDTDQVTEAHSESVKDQEWLDHFKHILHQKIPSVGQLMEALRVKMKERKVLTEELAALATPVSEKA
ncbi:centlein isoform X1 [Takifugu rubripes]|uniref:Centlein n=1 Tax=Takifugu rubripes TaxID=31033 RepID=H2TNS2_TAKRU|nr:centlein isoform X1 [Takifugu rubripes]XP_011611215.2 centlein isoform X1 [Takifugu rubripes]